MEENNKMERQQKILLVVLPLVAAILVGSIALGGSFIYYRGLEQQKADTDRTYDRLSATNMVGRIEESGIMDLSDVVEDVMPSIVAIDCTTTVTGYDFFFGSYSRDMEGSGSGVIFEEQTDHLFIMTNNHVVQGAKSIRITFQDGSIADGTVQGMDSAADLAVVAISKKDMEDEARKNVKVARLGETQKCKVGEMVLAIGNALGYGQSVTVGYISAKDRDVMVEDRNMVLLQTDAAINPGNSGGALVNLDGEVIGLNSVKYQDESVEGMGYAIPMERALPIVESLKGRESLAEAERGFLGIRYEAVSDEMNQMFLIPYGIYVDEVIKQSAAEESGLYAGDVITAVDGHEIRDVETWQSYMAGYGVGDKITLTIQRYNRGEYQEYNIQAVLGKKP